MDSVFLYMFKHNSGIPEAISTNLGSDTITNPGTKTVRDK